MSTVLSLSEKVKPDVKAVRIAVLHAEATASAKTALEKAFEIGALLEQRKVELGHGAFLPWVGANLPFSERAAQNYMAIHRHREMLKSANVADLTSAYLALAGAKKDEKSLENAYETLKKLRDSTEMEGGRWVFGAIGDGEAAEVPGPGQVTISVRGEYLFAIERAQGRGLFHVARVRMDGDAATVDAASRPVSAGGVAGFLERVGDSMDAIQWKSFPEFGRPTALNPWMFAPKDAYARQVA